MAAVSQFHSDAAAEESLILETKNLVTPDPSRSLPLSAAKGSMVTHSVVLTWFHRCATLVFNAGAVFDSCRVMMFNFFYFADGIGKFNYLLWSITAGQDQINAGGFILNYFDNFF